MREIKFRAWNRAFNKMEYCREESVVRDGHRERDSFVIAPDPTDQDKFWIIHFGHRWQVVGYSGQSMQFTGLHDKNGVEIYEGDILTHYSVIKNKENGCPKDDFSGQVVVDGIDVTVNKNPFPIHHGFEFNPYRVVEYLDGSEGYKERACYSPLYHNENDILPEDLVIVGNIYSNPELIK